MYCILVTGIPAAGKSTKAAFLAEHFGLPVISKDKIKEFMYDDIGFCSREEKVKLGIASMNIMYYMAAELMKSNQPFIQRWVVKKDKIDDAIRKIPTGIKSVTDISIRDFE